MPEQLELFGEVPGQPARTRSPVPGQKSAAPSRGDSALERRFASLEEVASRLPPTVRFGTSSWTFPGWRDLVYPTAASAASLARDGLRDYVRHPLLTTVGIDRSYYAPIPDADLQRYAEQLPDGFPCCAKAPASVTSAARPTAGPRSTDPNPAFLSVDRLLEELIAPFERAFRNHTGPFILQFPPVARKLRLSPEIFCERLNRFLGALPRTFQYAVEIRQREYLTPAYVRLLARHGVAHVYNYWTAMPTPGPQAEVLAPEEQPFIVIRLLLRPGASYEEQREAFAPFDRIRAASESMRDQVVSILERAVARQLPAFVLVNNKAEGSAPLTIEELAERLGLRLKASRG